MSPPNWPPVGGNSGSNCPARNKGLFQMTGSSICFILQEPKCCRGFFGPNCSPCPGGFSKPCSGNGQVSIASCIHSALQRLSPRNQSLNSCIAGIRGSARAAHSFYKQWWHEFQVQLIRWGKMNQSLLQLTVSLVPIRSTCARLGLSYPLTLLLCTVQGNNQVTILVFKLQRKVEYTATEYNYKHKESFYTERCFIKAEILPSSLSQPQYGQAYSVFSGEE